MPSELTWEFTNCAGDILVFCSPEVSHITYDGGVRLVQVEPGVYELVREEPDAE